MDKQLKKAIVINVAIQSNINVRKKGHEKYQEGPKKYPIPRTERKAKKDEEGEGNSDSVVIRTLWAVCEWL